MSDKTYETSQKNSLQAVSQIEYELNKVESLLFSSEKNERIISNLISIEDPSNLGISRLNAAKNLEENLFLLSNESEFIDSLLLITENNQYSSSNTVIDFSFNKLNLKQSSRTNLLLDQAEYLKNVTSAELSQDEINAIHDPRLDHRLFFASNITVDGSRLGQLWILIDNEALTSHLLNGHQYSIYYKGRLLKEGLELEEAHKIESELNEEPLIVIENAVASYDLSVKYLTRRFDNVNLTVLFVTLFFVLILLFIITYWLSKLISKQVLEPVTELLQWITKQKQTDEYFEYKRPKYSATFRTRLIGYFIITIFMPLLTTTLIFYSLSYTVVTDEIIKLNSSEHHSKSIQINNELNKIMKVLASYSVNLDMTNQIKDLSLNTVYSSLGSDSTLSKIDFLAVYNKFGKVIYTSDQNPPNRINLKGMKQINSKSRIYFYKYPVEDGVLITIVLSDRVTQKLPNSIKMIAVKIGSNYFSSLPYITDASVEYISQDDELYWNIGQEYPSDKPADNTFTLVSKLDINNLKYVSKHDLSIIQNDIRSLFFSQSYWLVIIILLIIIISMSLTNQIMRPFSRIIKNFQNKEGYCPEQELSQIDEIHELQINFEESIHQLNELMSERVENQKNALKLEYDRREIQLFAMQNQVNPHFLYNSLDNLLFLVESKEDERALMMINSLSLFFRYITDRRHAIVSVEQEVDFTKRYIDIMAVRFDNFVVTWNIEDSVKPRSMMKLALQPLVENSIQHGAAHSDRLVTIEISIKEINEGLKIIITDDGLGISEDKLKYIKNEINASSYNKSGLFNVRDRLELYYGATLEIDIESKAGEGTQVKFWIPFDIQ